MPRVRDKFVIGGERFATKKAVEERVRGILHNAPLGQLQGADRIFLTAFFSLHPNVKKALFIEEVYVALHPMGHRTFEVELTSGKRLDISYKKPLRALTGLDSHKADVLLAMRQAIHPQILAFRVRAQDGIVFGEDRVVDHKWPDTFDALVKRFLEAEGVTFSDVVLIGGPNRLGKELADRWHKKWTEFHREHAVLRLVDRRENSRWGNRDPELCGGEAS